MNKSFTEAQHNAPHRFVAVSVLILALGFFSQMRGSVATLFIANVVAGSGDGSSCGNAAAKTFFNNLANWGGGAGQIGPDTVVTICGTITGGLQTDGLTFQGSGTSGHPITLQWASGAIMTSAQWHSAVVAVNRSFIAIDGGTNGIIRNTASSSSSNPDPTQTFGVEINGGSNVEIKNLNIQNIYVHTGTATDGEITACINFDNSATANPFVHNNVCNDAKKGIFFAYGPLTNVEVSFNTITNIVWGVAFLDNNTGDTANGGLIHDNDISGFDNWWDSGFGFHYDAIFMAATNSSTQLNNFKVYNNKLHGSMDGNGTAYIYWSGDGGGLLSGNYTYNNIIIATRSTDGHGTGSGDGNITVGFKSRVFGFNNTIVSCQDRPGLLIRETGSVVNQWKNNLITGSSPSCTPFIAVQNKSGAVLSGGIFTNNGYFNLNAARFFEIGDGTSFFTSLAAWQTACSCDSASQVTNPNFTADFHIGSGALSTGGTNLTSLAIPTLNLDAAGVARPTSGAWAVGAYVFSSSTPAISASPNPVSMGSATVGVSGSIQVVTITAGGSVATTLGPVLISMNGTNPGDFAMIGGGSNPCAPNQVLAVAATCNLRFQMTPTATGARTATARVNGTATVDVVLNGTGNAVGTTILTASAPTIDFASVQQHTPSAIVVETITNAGTLPLTLSTPVTAIAGPFVADFQLAGASTCTAGLVLNHGDTCLKGLQATPSIVGLEQGMTATFGTTTPGVQAVVTMRVTGTAPVASINLTPRPVLFPDQTVLVAGGVVVVTLTNTGTVSQTLAASNALVITGANAAHFVKQGSSTCNNNSVVGISLTCHADYIWTPGASAGLEQVTLTATTTTGVTNAVTMQGNAVDVVTTPNQNPLLLSFKINFFPGVTITMNGANYVPGKTTLTVDGTPVQTSCASKTLCLATLPASMVLLPGFGIVGHLIGVK